MGSKPGTPRRQYPQLQWQVPELPAILLDPARDVQIPTQKKSATLGWNTPPVPTKPAQSSAKGGLDKARPQTSAGIPGRKPSPPKQAGPKRATGDFGPPAPRQSPPKGLVSAVKRSGSKDSVSAHSSSDVEHNEALTRPQRTTSGASKVDWALPAKAAVKAGQKLVGKLTPSGRSSRASRDSRSPLSASPLSRSPAGSLDRGESGAASDSKWSRLQALKAMRTAQARAALPERPSTSSAPPAKAAPVKASAPRLPAPARPAKAAVSNTTAPAEAPARKPLFGLRKPKVSADQASSQPARPPPLEQPQQSAEARAQLDMYAAAAAAAPREQQGDLVTCQGCDRTFIPEAYERHARICAKVFQTKRKAYNATAARAPDELSDGTFGAPPPPPARGGRASATGAKAAGSKAGAGAGAGAKAGGKAAKWKAQSSQLRAAMAAARGAANGDPTVFAAPVVDDSLTPCPHCGRRFNDKAAERHIPLCKDIRAKPTSLRAGGGRGAGAFAKR